ncbi:MAG: hypothetical protein AMS26_17905 [Bacteroides sp. SM23_62]|nr:MAG: hypothetical protein AMS26_17905 [Bacteroides sp. SM23_62]
MVILSIHITGTAQPFVKGDKAINLGLGIDSTLYSGVGYDTGLPPLSASFEYGLTELGPGVLGIGSYFGLSFNKWIDTWSGSTYGWRYSSTIIGARGNYHYNFSEKLDTYAGLMLGYDIISSKATVDWPAFYDDLSANSSTFIWSFYVGAGNIFPNHLQPCLNLGTGLPD